MKRSMLALFFWAFSNSLYADYQDNQTQVAVVLAKADKPVTWAIKDFYNKSYSGFSRMKKWQLADTDAFFRALKPGQSRGTLIPTIAKSALDEALKKSKDEDRYIAELQRALDTLALKGAVIVSCDTNDASLISSCSLHYYDRAKARVYATVSKNFVVPVSDASIWAAPLSKHLQEGLAAKSRQDEESKVEKLLAYAEENSAGRRGFSLLLSVANEQLHTKSYGTKSHLTGSIAGLVTRNQSGVGLEFGTGRSSASEQKIESRNVALLVNTYVRAMESARWNLDVAAGASERKITTTAGLIAQKSAFARVEPGFSWEVLDNFNMGASFRYTRYFGGSNAAPKDSNEKLNTSNIGFGIKIGLDF